QEGGLPPFDVHVGPRRGAATLELRQQIRGQLQSRLIERMVGLHSSLLVYEMGRHDDAVRASYGPPAVPGVPSFTASRLGLRGKGELWPGADRVADYVSPRGARLILARLLSRAAARAGLARCADRQ